MSLSKMGGGGREDIVDLSLRSKLWFLGARKKRPLLPWEQEGSLLHRVLGDGPSSYKFPKLAWPDEKLLIEDSLSTWSTLDTASDFPIASASVVQVSAKSWLSRSVKSKAWQDSRSEARTAVLQSWKVLVVASGDSTKLGKTICVDSGSDEQMVFDSIRDAFSGKAVSTLKSRANALLCYMRWKSAGVKGSALGVFPLSEAEAYAYICHLRREGAPKSRLAGFFQAVGFSKGLLGAEVDAVLSSPRVKGACSNTEPHVVAKKSPLSVEEVVLIERMAFQSRGQDGIIAGFVCFVLHSRLRWTDAMHVDAEPILDVADGHGYLEASVYSHKTAAAFKWQVLPVVSVLPGVSGLVWAEPWLQNRQAHGLRACRAVPFQPAPLAWGGWAAVPFDACHGAIWLREKLSAFRTDPEASMALATHSLKATVLSWLSKAACPSDLQRRAGYHVSASEKNPLEYERDGQAGVLHFIHAVYSCIQASLFFPDHSRSGRWSGCSTVEQGMSMLRTGSGATLQSGSAHDSVDSEPGDESDAGQVPEDGASEADEVMAESAVQEVDGYVAPQVQTPGVVAFCHVVSGVVHVSDTMHPDDDGESTKFRCGRTANANYRKLRFVPAFNTRQCALCWT